MKILTGDIGGTKTRLALIQREGDSLRVAREEVYPSGDYPGLEPIIAAFLSQLAEPPDAAGLAIAGPIKGRRCSATNLPWIVDADELERELGIPHVALLNDLEAVAWGLPALEKDDLHTLQVGLPDATGNRAVIAAGTGLGEAGLYWDGERHHPFATEGGHCDFAPSSELECQLADHLHTTFGRACWEDLVSGPGLVSLYRFLLQQQGKAAPEWLDQSADPAAEIAAHADKGNDAIAIQTLEQFVRLYGAEAGNLALKQMATGGLYLGGGIAPKILSWLQEPGFQETFCAKGKMQGLMEGIPVKVILNDRVALYGAARFAAKN